jgi:hypothetical protein
LVQAVERVRDTIDGHFFCFNHHQDKSRSFQLSAAGVPASAAMHWCAVARMRLLIRE